MEFSAIALGKSSGSDQGRNQRRVSRPAERLRHAHDEGQAQDMPDLDDIDGNTETARTNAQVI